MKNLLTYTGPAKQFSKEDAILAKIQIDNSFDLGWKKEDILLVTDFPFEYNGVKSLVIKDKIYYDFDINAGKIPVVVYLLQQNIISDNTLYWCHDFDAYENHAITEEELGLEDVDLGLTHYTYKPEWQCGSIFIKRSAFDMLELLHNTTLKRPHSSRNNEKTLTHLINHNALDPKRYKRLNVTYNIMKKFLPVIYPQAEKPIKVLHFRPSNKDPQMTETALEIFMYGKSRLKMPLMSDRLIKIFHHHGIK